MPALFVLVLPLNAALASGYTMPEQEAAARAFDFSFRNLSLKTSCGGHPGKHSYKKRRGVHIFTMQNGDIGKCPTDPGSGFSGKDIPHSERAEIQGQKFSQGARYVFKADYSMDSQFATGPKTTVFQVHQWVTGKCECGPYVMVFFDRAGKLKARILKSHHKHAIKLLGNFTRGDSEGRWQEIAVDIDTASSRPKVRIYVGGRLVLTDDVLVQSNGSVYFKTGLYRHGRRSSPLPADRMYVKNIGFAEVTE